MKVDRGDDATVRLAGLHVRMLQYRYIPLLICLVLMIGVWPVFEDYSIGPVLLRLLTLSVLVTGVYALSYNRKIVVIAVLISLPALISTVAVIVFESIPYQLYISIFLLLFYGFITLVILGSVLRDEIVTVDTIYGALCVYLLIGTTWAVGYNFLESLQPGSFLVNPALSPDGTLRFGELLYFSFVTITTLGYGDITPLIPATRSLASLEAVTGVLYTAVLVARLVGSYSAKGTKK
jgi:hypothetical protein